MHINRPDLAENTLRILKSVDEDNCLTILSTTWVNVSLLTGSIELITNVAILSMLIHLMSDWCLICVCVML